MINGSKFFIFDLKIAKKICPKKYKRGKEKLKIKNHRPLACITHVHSGQVPTRAWGKFFFLLLFRSNAPRMHV